MRDDRLEGQEHRLPGRGSRGGGVAMFPDAMAEPLDEADQQGERAMIGRLIRRLRVSDPPARFQTLATNVLRTSLNVAVAAWLPADPREPSVISGELPGFSSALARRRLTVAAPGDSIQVVNDPDDPAAPEGLAVIRRFAVVPAGAAGWLVVANPLDDRPIDASDIERTQYVASLIATQGHNAKIHSELKDLLFGVVRALTAAIDAKDPYTSGHSERVARIAVRLAEELNMPPQKRGDLYLAGLLHDVGKIGIDDDVLKKNGPLTDEEHRKIREHPLIGTTILRDLRRLQHILPTVRHHHEQFDGSGYPDRLEGETIPHEARILAVADSFDAMSSNRPYRKRLSPLQIDEIFRKGRGVQWDPEVVDALFACRADLEAIREKGIGESLIGAVDGTLGR